MSKKKQRKPPAREQPSHRLAAGLAMALIASLAFNFYLLLKPQPTNEAASPMPSPQKTGNFLRNNITVSCENKQVFESSLPQCPSKHRPIILPRHYPIHSVTIGFEEGMLSTGFFQTVLSVSRSAKPRIPLHVLVPKFQMKEASIELGQYLEGPDKGLIQIISTPSKYTVWAQDYFKHAIDPKTGKHHVIDLPYTEAIGEHIPTALALACNSNLIAQAPINFEELENAGGNFGGNIEALTDDLLLIGNSMDPRQREILRKELSQKMVEIDVQWLKVGHVDELFSLIPNGQSNRCPFDMLYASPEKATELMKREAKRKNRKSLDYRYGFSQPSSTFDAFECFETRNAHPGCKDLFGANEVYEKIIQKSASQIREALKESGCPSVRFQAIPVLFTPSQRVAKFGTTKDEAITIDPNPVNNALLGDTLILPQQNLDIFHTYTQEALKKYPLETVFANSTYVHRFNGGIHCALNTRHACTPNQGTGAVNR